MLRFNWPYLQEIIEEVDFVIGFSDVTEKERLGENTRQIFTFG